MKIGLLSDTHDYWDDRFLLHFNDCDEIWHAGDMGSMDLANKFEQFKPFRAVYGNIDNHKLRAAFPEFLRFEVEGVDILMTHIGGYPNKYSPEVLKLLKIRPPKLFICGHSHILRVIYDTKYACLTMNPGAAGKFGFHKVRTLLRFVIAEGTIKDLEVIELR